AEIIKKFNNQFLNEVEPFTKVNPTLENLTDYLFNRFGEELNKLNCSLDEISVSESPMRTYQISIR
ncbi:6-carboxytetrahydropterin synthase, partial [Lactobacillus crispatus]